MEMMMMVVEGGGDLFFIVATQGNENRTVSSKMERDYQSTGRQTDFNTECVISD
jgi:hypothetical protein